MATNFRIGATFASTTNVSTGTTGAITTTSGDAATIHGYTTQGQPVSSVTDSKGNTYTLVSGLPYTLGGTTFFMYAYTCPNIVGGAGHTATVAVSGGGVEMVFFFSTWSGVATIGTLLDGAAGTHLDSGFIQSHPGASMTTAATGSIIIQHSIAQNVATEVFTSGSGYTTALSALGSGSTYIASLLQYKAAAPSGAQAGPYTTTNFDQCGDVIIALAAPGNFLPAAFGPFAITGQAVTFTVTSAPVNLLAFPGTYNLSGAPASSDFNISASHGAYAYTGSSASLVEVISGLFASAGSYSVTGHNATLLFLNYQLGAAAGGFSYTGYSAQLVPVISPVALVAGTGSYSLAGQNALLTFRIPAAGFRVRAVTPGWYNDTYYQIGDVFDLNLAQDYSDSTVNYQFAGNETVFGWMLSVPQNTPLFQAQLVQLPAPLFPVDYTGVRTVM